MGKGRLAEEPGGLNWEVLWLVIPMSLVFDQQCEIALAASSFFPLPLFCILNIPHIQPHCSTVDILGMFRAACTQSLWANRFSGIPGFRQLCQSVFLIDLNERNKHVITPGGNVSGVLTSLLVCSRRWETIQVFVGGLRVAFCTKRRADQTLQEAHRGKAI